MRASMRTCAGKGGRMHGEKGKSAWGEGQECKGRRAKMHGEWDKDVLSFLRCVVKHDELMSESPLCTLQTWEITNKHSANVCAGQNKVCSTGKLVLPGLLYERHQSLYDSKQCLASLLSSPLS